jgi:putative DNA primase/helicase
VWDGKRWNQDESGEIERRGKLTVRRIYAEAAETEDKDLREKIANHAHKSESAARIGAMIELSRSEKEIPIQQTELDCDPWLLNVRNGTLNLKTMELWPHGREDFITKLIDVDYFRDALCPVWEAFVARITGEKDELRRFVQKAVGYSLTASTREQCLFILFGLGANGKTTFITVISSLLADYAKQTRTETLLVKHGDQIPNDVARLAGARFVCAIETESGKRLAESLVKQMTGGDKMAARFLHHEYFEFQPTFKLWLAVNHKPRIRGTDHAIWRRIRILPFDVTIPPDEQDPDLIEKLRGELPGILRWATEGCQLWQDHGLKAPEAVTSATEQYREESDNILTFIDECCERDPDAEVTKGTLYEAYNEWARKSGEYPVTKRDFGGRLLEKGFSEHRIKKGRFWKGIKLI